MGHPVIRVMVQSVYRQSGCLKPDTQVNTKFK